jgi:hypothetical protein
MSGLHQHVVASHQGEQILYWLIRRMEPMPDGLYFVVRLRPGRKAPQLQPALIGPLFTLLLADKPDLG